MPPMLSNLQSLNIFASHPMLRTTLRHLGTRCFGAQLILGRRASTLDSQAVAAFAALEHENWEKAMGETHISEMI